MLHVACSWGLWRPRMPAACRRWQALMVVMDNRPFPELRQIVRNMSDDRIWVYAEWVSPRGCILQKNLGLSKSNCILRKGRMGPCITKQSWHGRPSSHSAAHTQVWLLGAQHCQPNPGFSFKRRVLFMSGPGHCLTCCRSTISMPLRRVMHGIRITTTSYTT